MNIVQSALASDAEVVNKSILKKQKKFENYLKAVKDMCEGTNPSHKAIVDKANAAMRQKFLTPGAVHVDATLASISVQYANEEYIGDSLMPVATVPKLSDVYFKYDKRSRLAYPDDYVGARSSPNEINDSRSTDNYSCRPYAFKNYIDALTLANQDAPLNEMVDLVQAIAEGIAFRRELRIASAMTTSGNYANGNTVSLAAGSRWDTAGGGNPIKDIQTAVAALWNGRGATKKVGFCDLDTWNVLARHPMILDLFKYKDGNPDLAMPSMVAPWFGLDDILVGKARKDTANEAQTASYARIWPNCFGVARVASSPSIRTAAFGYTFRFGQVLTDEWFDPSLGTQGGYYARVSTKEDHKIVANDTGYLILTPIN